jgi:hypothetical protein
MAVLASCSNPFRSLATNSSALTALCLELDFWFSNISWRFSKTHTTQFLPPPGVRLLEVMLQFAMFLRSSSQIAVHNRAPADP